MPDLVPVDQQPEFDHTLQPVEYDPFSVATYANPTAASEGSTSDPWINAVRPDWRDVEARQNLAAQPAPSRSLGEVASGALGKLGSIGHGIIDTARNALSPDLSGPAALGDQARYVATELPRRALQAAANYQPGVPETYDPAPAADVAMTLAGVGMPAAEAGAAGIFGGKLSKLADHAAIAKAEQMEAAGADASSIWKETGTARGADKQWRQEIDDSAAKLKMQPKETVAAEVLDEVLDHPELYKAYPHLRDVGIEPLPEGLAKNSKADYSAETNTIRMNTNLSPDQFKSTLLHEIQHDVQNKEGFAPGDNPANHIPPALGPAQRDFEAVRADTQAEIAKTYNTNPLGVEYMKDLIRRDKYGAEAAKQNISKPFEDVFRVILNRNPDVARRLGNIVDSEKLIDDAHAAAYEKYRAAMGEVESRSVQDRMKMSPAERAAIHPIYNEEIPRSQQRDPRLSGASSDAPAASVEPPSIRAYHGSPHDFDKFDISKINTGEGAQAYGHGLYFADREGVARNYRDNLSARVMEEGFTPAERGSDAHTALQDEASYQSLLDSGGTEFEYDRRPMIRMPDGSVAEFNQDGIYAAHRWPSGKMYEVNINADPEHFLDWDKPLSEQHPKVQEALGKIGIKPQGGWEAADNEANTFLRRGARGIEGHVRQIDRGNGPEWLASYDTVDGRGSQRFPSQEAAQKWIDTQAPIEAGRGAEVYQTARKNLPDDQISQRLREANIPGIKYLDQGSRAAGEGSRNYVVFDDKLIDIIKKYGIAGLPAGLAAAAARQFVPVDNNPFADGS